jgi:hypothetical protein
VPAGEWEAFMASLRSSLPACFRVTTGPAAAEMRAALRGDSFGLEGFTVPAHIKEGALYTSPLQLIAIAITKAAGTSPLRTARRLSHAAARRCRTSTASSGWRGRRSPSPGSPRATRGCRTSPAPCSARPRWARPSRCATTVATATVMRYRYEVLITGSPRKAFHEWLIRHNQTGAINRQEAVSMIPPMLLDARPGHA